MKSKICSIISLMSGMAFYIAMHSSGIGWQNWQWWLAIASVMAFGIAIGVSAQE